MTELVKGSTGPDNTATVYAVNLLRHYGFELEHETIEQLLAQWLKRYSINWVRLAIVEALYQGRYKAISVGQILALWQRRGQPLYHFNHEFERLVCDRFPRNLLSSSEDDSQSSSSLNPGLLYQRIPFQPVEPILPFSQPHSAESPQPVAEERSVSMQPVQPATDDPSSPQSASGDGTPENTQFAQSSSGSLLEAIAPLTKTASSPQPPTDTAKVAHVESTIQTPPDPVDTVDLATPIANGNQLPNSTDSPCQGANQN
ncbi:hypothetical protein [Leptothermofonsia sp. ETS-13]|uniref:hypothetical protein n=1 Tax=Leptothermofonsia sp. ETS-13 TaxID=3035696 RepID=UPI003B9FC4F4